MAQCHIVFLIYNRTLHTLAKTAQLFCLGRGMCGNMSGQRHQLVIDGVDDPAILREEELIKLKGRCDPVLSPDYSDRSIKIVKAQVADVMCNIVEE